MDTDKAREYENGSGRVALVTGAGMGIGSAIAKRLADAGHTVIVSDINIKAADDVAGEIAGMGLKAVAMKLDVGDESSIKNAFSEVERRFGRCDVLVNNAGVAKLVNFFGCPIDDWNRVININLNGTLLCSQHAAKLMSNAGWGRIINVTSISGMRASAGRVAYGTSKTAVIGLTRQMAVELAEHGINVNGVAPGPIDTALAREVHSSETRQAYERAVPMRRYGTASEVAGVIAFLASDDASYVSGHIIPVDGGYMASGILDI